MLRRMVSKESLVEALFITRHRLPKIFWAFVNDTLYFMDGSNVSLQCTSKFGFFAAYFTIKRGFGWNTSDWLI